MGNKIRVDGTVAMMELTQGQVATFDVGDLPLLTPYTWHAIKNHSDGFYAATNIERRTTYMHRLILGLDEKRVQADHIDHDGLNNRRGNLRATTNIQNNQNRSGAYRSKNSTGIRGVCIDHRGSQTYYKARVMSNYMTVAQEYFPFTPEGLQAADEWAKQTRKIFFTHDGGS